MKIDSLTSIYEDARNKDAIFDDPATVAYQIEQGIQFLQKNPDILPQMFIEIDYDDFYNFYQNTTSWIYQKLDSV